MRQIITPALRLIDKTGIPFIIIVGIIVLLLLIWNAAKLSSKKDRIEEALFSKDSKYFKDAIKHELSREEDTASRPTPDKIRSLETDFYNTCSIHDVLVQIIPIFPLLGILGTVAGLMIQAGSSNDMSAIVGGLNTALDTTFFGIVFAIILKFVEAVFPSRIINSTEIMLDDFNKKMYLVDMFQNTDNKQ